MIAVENEALKASCNTCNCTGFVPGATFTYDSGDEEVIVTEASSFDSGDGLKKMNVEVTDQFGNKAVGATATAAANVTVDVSELDASKGLDVKVTISTTGGCVADGGAYKIASEGTIGSWNKGFTSSEAANISAPPTLVS